MRLIFKAVFAAAFACAATAASAQDTAQPAPASAPAASPPPASAPAVNPRGPVPYTSLQRPQRPRPVARTTAAAAAPTAAATTTATAAPGVPLTVAPALPAAASGALAPGEAIPAAELESYVDGVVRSAMNRDHIAGVTVSVVQNGGGAEEGLWHGRPVAGPQGRSRPDLVPHRLDLQDLHLDRADERDRGRPHPPGRAGQSLPARAAADPRPGLPHPGAGDQPHGSLARLRGPRARPPVRAQLRPRAPDGRLPAPGAAAPRARAWLGLGLLQLRRDPRRRGGVLCRRQAVRTADRRADLPARADEQHQLPRTSSAEGRHSRRDPPTPGREHLRGLSLDASAAMSRGRSSTSAKWRRPARPRPPRPIWPATCSCC